MVSGIMDAENLTPDAEDSADPAQRSLIEDLRHMLADGRALIGAELAFHKSRAVAAGAGAKGIATWLLLALALMFLALMALVMGSLLILSAWYGPLAATGMTVGFLLGTTAAALLAARRRWKRMMRVLSAAEPAP